MHQCNGLVESLLAGAGTGYAYSLPWDYPRYYSWELGRDINNISSRTPTTTYFTYAKNVVLYPSAFDKHSPQLGNRSGLTVMILHFVAYCRGAAGIRTLPTTLGLKNDDDDDDAADDDVDDALMLMRHHAATVRFQIVF